MCVGWGTERGGLLLMCVLREGGRVYCLHLDVRGWGEVLHCLPAVDVKGVYCLSFGGSMKILSVPLICKVYACMTG